MKLLIHDKLLIIILRFSTKEYRKQKTKLRKKKSYYIALEEEDIDEFFNHDKLILACKYHRKNIIEKGNHKLIYVCIKYRQCGADDIVNRCDMFHNDEEFIQVNYEFSDGWNLKHNDLDHILNPIDYQ